MKLFIFFFLITAFQACIDAFTYRSWQKTLFKNKYNGEIAHLFEAALMLVICIFVAYSAYRPDWSPRLYEPSAKNMILILVAAVSLRLGIFDIIRGSLTKGNYIGHTDPIFDKPILFMLKYKWFQVFYQIFVIARLGLVFLAFIILHSLTY